KMKSNKEQKYFWLTFSLIVALMIWWFLSNYDRTSRSFPNIILVWNALLIMIDKGFIFEDIFSSLTSVFFGFTSGFLLSAPNALLMAWYSPYRNIVKPWIEFIRNIPPLAYVPLVVISAGVGLLPQVIVIAIATFLTMTVTIYQGIINIDPNLIKAARILGASDFEIFKRILVPSSIPFIMTAVRLGTSISLTTIIAAESTGATSGMGMRIRSLNNSFDSSGMLLYIILIGVIGLLLNKLVDLIERKLTGWQQK
ncbi:TPA: ABC transporter permease, partial [Streptococcus suis]